MGGSIIIVPHSSVRYDFTIPKLNKIPHMSQFTDKGFIPLQTYEPSIDSQGLESVKLMNLDIKYPRNMEIKVKDTDFFWMFAHHATKFNFKELKGIIDDLYGYNYIKARVSVLPFVDNSPTSMDTIYTVLAYSRDQCIKLKQKKYS